MKNETREAIFKLIDKLDPFAVGNCTGEIDGKRVVVRVYETEQPRTVMVVYDGVEILKVSDESFANEVFEYIQEKNEDFIFSLVS